MRPAARVVSAWVASIGISSGCTSALSLRLSCALPQMLKVSGMVTIRSTPTASSPSMTRRTMFTFSLLLNTEP